MAYTNQVSLLNLQTSTTSSIAVGFAVGDRHLMSVQFIATQVTSGNGIFKIQVSNTGDLDDYVTYNRLVDNLTNASSAFDTRVGSSTLSANGSKIYFFPEGDHFEYIRATLARTTDGSYSAVLHTVVE